MKIVRDRPVESAVAATAALLTLLCGNGWFVTWLTATFGELAIPAALNIPPTLPGLRLWPSGESTWSHTIAETVAALGFIAFVVGWIHGTSTRRTTPSTLRVALSAWAATILGLAAANVLRVTTTSFAQDADFGTYLAYLGGGIVIGALWGALSGLLIAAVAGVAHRLSSPTDTATEPVEATAPPETV